VEQRGREVMSLEDLGNIGELVAAVAVVVSLIYLAVQIRQNTSNIDFNTKALRGSTYTSQFQLNNDFQDLLFQNERIGNIWIKGMHRPNDLDEVESRYFRNLASRFLRMYESLFLMRELQLIDDELFQSSNAVNSIIFARPGIQVFWNGHRNQFAASFQAFLDNLPPAKHPDEGFPEEAAKA
jgi:hypothetical protein